MFDDFVSPPKGKGKEKQASQTHYPIVLLLSLLERSSLLKTPSLMESVVSLLALVTRPLVSLQQQKATDVEKQPSESSNVEQPTQAAGSSTDTSTQPAAPVQSETTCECLF